MHNPCGLDKRCQRNAKCSFCRYAVYTRQVNWRLVEDGETRLAQQTERHSYNKHGRYRPSNISNASVLDTRNMQESESKVSKASQNA